MDTGKQPLTPPDSEIAAPPKGIAVLAILGPSMVWAAEYIGSGEVILATRLGAILGTGILWAIVIGIVLKFWIGVSGARYTVTTGEGMIDMFDRIPGPRHWVVWIVLVAQLIAGALSIGSVASAAGAFVSSVIPVSSYVGGWAVSLLAVGVVWSGGFRPLKIVMSLFVLVTVIGVGYVALTVFPGVKEFILGLLPSVPRVPDWALSKGVTANPWQEILPLLGWGAGGFASQVWYSYWVIGAGYGAASHQEYGQPADRARLKRMTRLEAEKIRGWNRVVYVDATLAMVIGVVVTVAFAVAGAGVLSPLELAPEGPQVGITLSKIFSTRWGSIGGLLFLLGGMAALIGTNVGQLAGWPRLLADAFRICIPGFQRRFSWKVQFRLFLLFFLFTNMVIVFTLGLRPVLLVQLSAILDGLLLTPLQALCVGVGLFIVMPKMVNDEVRDLIRPHWIFAAGLAIAFLVFGYFCVFQIPNIL